MFMFKYPFDTKCNFMSAQDTIKNPYRQTLKDNPRDIFTEGRDQRTRTGQFEAAAAEFDADLALMDYQNEYNDPTNKAARMRAAGLNPDLIGVSDASDSSGLSGLSGSVSPTPDSRNTLDNVSQILDNAQNVVGTFFDAYSQVQGINARSINNDIGRVNLDNLLHGRASQFLSDNSDIDDLTSVMDFTKYLGLSKKATKRYMQNISTLQTGISGDVIKNKKRNELAQSRYDLQSTKSQYGYSDDDSDMFNALKAWNDFVHDCDKVSKSASKSQNKYTGDYYNNMSGATMAKYDSEGARLDNVLRRNQVSNAKAESYFNKAKSRLYGKLDSYGIPGQLFLLALGSGAVGNAANLGGQMLLKRIPVPKVK